MKLPPWKSGADDGGKGGGKNAKGGKGDKGGNTAMLEALKLISEKMDIKGGYAKPHWSDVLWVQLVILPYTIYRWSQFYCRWLWKFGIKREEYGRDEKLYVIRLVVISFYF